MEISPTNIATRDDSLEVNSDTHLDDSASASNDDYDSKLNLALQERDEISKERDSLKSQLELAFNENKILIVEIIVMMF